MSSPDGQDITNIVQGNTTEDDGYSGEQWDVSQLASLMSASLMEGTSEQVNTTGLPATYDSSGEQERMILDEILASMETSGDLDFSIDDVPSDCQTLFDEEPEPQASLDGFELPVPGWFDDYVNNTPGVAEEGRPHTGAALRRLYELADQMYPLPSTGALSSSSIMVDATATQARNGPLRVDEFVTSRFGTRIVLSEQDRLAWEARMRDGETTTSEIDSEGDDTATIMNGDDTGVNHDINPLAAFDVPDVSSPSDTSFHTVDSPSELLPELSSMELELMTEASSVGSSQLKRLRDVSPGYQSDREGPKRRRQI